MIGEGGSGACMWAGVPDVPVEVATVAVQRSDAVRGTDLGFLSEVGNGN
jgi:hypothetical protein